ncbi:hypothetical protein CL656_07200 [bacterium]|nr:hypothetical protein [bacterium]
MPKKSGKSLSRKSKSKSSKSLLNNKLVLYLSLILFIFNVVAFLFFKDMQSLFLFVIVLCITYLFDRNMIVVLLVPILFVGLLIFLRKSFMNNELVEGFKEAHNQKSEDEGEVEEKEEKEDEGEVEEPEQKEDEGEVKVEEKNTESYANLKNDSIKSELNNLVNKYEKAQKGLSETLEKSSIDPQSLETQKLIIKQMNEITPVIKDSVKILNKVDMNGLNNLLGSLGSVLGSNPIPKPTKSSTKI